jgi:hypothetical protein
MSRTLGLVLGISSVVVAAGMLAAIPWYVRRMPADFFVRPRPRPPLPKLIARNLAGLVLVALGVALLVLPGQGLLTILLGLSLLDFPAKHRAIGWLLGRRVLRAGMQKLRHKLGQPPLALPG